MTKLRILHIDNDALSRSVVRAMLSLKDVELVEIASATVGGEMVRDGGYDLVLMDLWMNDMGGLELLRSLRADPATADIPISIVTGDARAAVTETCLNAGASRVIHKPLRMSDLFDLVSDVQAEVGARLAA